MTCLGFGPLLWADSPPRDPDGRTEPFTLSYGRYDDFDGHGGWRAGQGHLAVEGDLSVDLWKGRGEVVAAEDATTNPEDHGKVLRLSKPAGDDDHAGVTLRNPTPLSIESIHSLRADVLIPSGTTVDTNASLRISAWLEELPYRHWGVSLDIGPREWQEAGEVWINACWNDVGVEEGVCEGVPGYVDLWYDLRIDLKRTPGKRLEVGFFVDGVKIASAVPGNAEILFEHERTGGGANREINLWRPDDGGDAVALVDDVWASYQTRKNHSQTLYDDFDGHGGYRAADDSHLAVAGELSTDLWNGQGQVKPAAEYTTAPMDRWRVLVLQTSPEGNDGVWLANPTPIDIDAVGTFAADVLIPASSNPHDFGLDLQVSASLPGLEDPYWRTWFGFGADEDGNLGIWGCWDHLGIDQSTCRNVDADPDTWYNLRIDLVPFGRAVRADLYVNDLLLQSGVTDPTGLLLDAVNIDGGPRRQIYVWNSEENGRGAALVDDVHATYHRLTLESITPNRGLQGERIPVLITGEGFREGVIPFATEWGVSFVDIVVVDDESLRATAVIDDLAPSGSREIAAVDPTATGYSTSSEYEILENDALLVSDFAYGMYEDFDDPEKDGPWYLGRESEASLKWWSTGHQQTYPVVSQKDGRLRLATVYDGERGYWLSMRLAEPEGTIASENSTLHMARTVSVDYTIPPGQAPWWGPRIGFQGRYAEGTWGVKWDMMLYLDRSEMTAPPVAGYVMGRVFHYHDPDNTIEWVGEGGGRFEGLELTDGGPINLRFDVVDTGDGGFLIDLFVDHLLRARVQPADARRLWNEIDWVRGPVRIIQAGAPLEEGIFNCYIDNIKAVYPVGWQ